MKISIKIKQVTVESWRNRTYLDSVAFWIRDSLDITFEIDSTHDTISEFLMNHVLKSKKEREKWLGKEGQMKSLILKTSLGGEMKTLKQLTLIWKELEWRRMKRNERGLVSQTWFWGGMKRSRESLSERILEEIVRFERQLCLWLATHWVSVVHKPFI